MRFIRLSMPPLVVAFCPHLGSSLARDFLDTFHVVVELSGDAFFFFLTGLFVHLLWVMAFVWPIDVHSNFSCWRLDLCVICIVVSPSHVVNDGEIMIPLHGEGFFFLSFFPSFFVSFFLFVEKLVFFLLHDESQGRVYTRMV